MAGQRVARVLLQGLRLTPFAERPMHLCTTWLARLPRQHVPPGFKPMAWNDILRPWARRRICASLNATADRDFECLHKGGSALRRPSSICIGSYNALSIVYELDQATGLYDFHSGPDARIGPSNTLEASSGPRRSAAYVARHARRTLGRTGAHQIGQTSDR